MTQPSKAWVALKSGHYQLLVNDQVAGELVLATSSLHQRGEVALGKNKYTIRQTGF